ncbi:hypothetical protein LO772_13590 [Yinghuangia sp. ASG 101]|uniref:dimethylarginine dimethylaminohydrolase family protein n=1 Tax=Yinghuangia sp. ASG 101 TaxID=2896848 RepID=UPI001E40574A|nr:hypothetical protein [Yinghuangia sp. ASG 101]UGQ14520.1 hypothetical protein LO772_13590 [Yinghuangia sp. ASG 101]
MRLTLPPVAGASTMSPATRSRRTRMPRPRHRREAVGRQASRRVYVMCPPTHHAGAATDAPRPAGTDDGPAGDSGPARSPAVAGSAAGSAAGSGWALTEGFRAGSAARAAAGGTAGGADGAGYAGYAGYSGYSRSLGPTGNAVGGLDALSGLGGLGGLSGLGDFGHRGDLGSLGAESRAAGGAAGGPPESPMEQWERLREVLLRLGHTVSLIPPRGGLPGMVFAAHAATVVDGRVLGARYRSMARQPESPAYLRWFADRGYRTRLEPVFAHEGETDLIPAGSHLLAAYGPHTEARAHAEAGDFLGLPVVPLELTNPRITRLGSAIAVLTDRTIAYHPAAFSATARERLARMFPERIPVGEEDTLAGGLDAICDGRTVVLTDRAPGLAAQLARHGFRTIAVDMSCFAGLGAGVRSCVLELRVNH